MVERKKLTSAPKKERKSKNKAVRKSFDYSKLPDAYIEEKFIAPKGSVLIVSRVYFQKTELHECTVLRLDEKFHVVELWDETLQQIHVVSLKQKLPEVFKIKTMVTVQPATEVIVASPIETLEEGFVVKL